ncbi:MAG: C_GCAxxG_C_C family protein [Ruminococcus sp.]|nr:C_GCAxxG_C_C family protein [Ruminococcus sp.]
MGYNCSQSVLGAWAEDIGIDINTAMTLSQSFGGGMGRLREVCGACSGAFMVLGVKYGTDNPKDSNAKKALYQKVQKFAERFKEENGYDSIVCRDLLGLDGSSKPVPAKRTNEYYKKRPCVELVGLAAGLLDEFM